MELLGESLVLLGGFLFFVGGFLYWKGRTRERSVEVNKETGLGVTDLSIQLREKDALIRQLVGALQPFGLWFRSVSKELPPGSREKEEFEAVLKALDAAKEQGF